MERDPFASVIPENTEVVSVKSPTPVASSGRRSKLTVSLDVDLIDRVKNAAYWNPRLNIAKIAELGIKQAIEEVERENGGRYKQRESNLKSGHPMK
jgi:hypothetical protein